MADEKERIDRLIDADNQVPCAVSLVTHEREGLAVKDRKSYVNKSTRPQGSLYQHMTKRLFANRKTMHKEEVRARTQIICHCQKHFGKMTLPIT